MSSGMAGAIFWRIATYDSYKTMCGYLRPTYCSSPEISKLSCVKILFVRKFESPIYVEPCFSKVSTKSQFLLRRILSNTLRKNEDPSSCSNLFGHGIPPFDRGQFVSPSKVAYIPTTYR